MGESVIIIGAGIAGLAAGCYAQMNGYRSQIFEMHDLPGGLCTAWERRGYVFDGCIHYLLGSGPGQPYHRMWEELGAIQGRRMIHHAELMRVIGPDGKTFIAYADPDELERHMKMLSPADARLIEDFCAAIRQFAHFDHSAMQAKPRSLMGPGDWAAFGMKMLPFLGPLAKWALVSAEDFAARFSDPFLRRAFPKVFGWPEIPMMAAISLLGAMHAGNAAFPAGASLEFARALERRYLALGGEIHYKAQVERILVERQGGKARAAGVRLYSNDEHRADTVISAADGRGTIFGLLDGEFADRKIRRTYDGHLPIYSQFQVSLGVNRDLSGEPHWATYLLDEPALIVGRRAPRGRRQTLLLRPQPGPGRQIGRDRHAAHRLRLLAAHLRPPALRRRANRGVRPGDRLPGADLSGVAPGHRGGGRGDAAELRALHRQLAGQQHGLAADHADDDHEHHRHAEDAARAG